MGLTEKNSQIKALIRSCGILWQIYGGWRTFICSPYLWIAFIITIILSSSKHCDWRWYEKAIGVLPDLLGFSLGGYAVMLAFGDKNFLNAIRGEREDEEHSPYIITSTSLAYFVIIQIITLILAVVYDALYMKHTILNFIGCWIFIYSLLLGFAATLSIFFLSRMYDKLPFNADQSSLPKNNNGET